MSMEKIKEFFQNHNWKIVENFCENDRKAEFAGSEDLELSQDSQALLRGYEGLYKHQHECVKRFKTGANVCLSTPTASGKTLAFQICALETLSKDPQATILATLPSRALSHDQVSRWKRDMEKIGHPANFVTKIDGSVEVAKRLEMLKGAKVVLMTPDVVHAWLLRNIHERPVRDYLANLRLLVVDEVHNYSGAFGSNAAYMYRRLKNLALLCGRGGMKIVAASATINEPKKHLEDLFGDEFAIVGEEFDSSLRHSKSVWMVDPGDKGKLLTQFVPFIKYLAENFNRKFLAFVDNRQYAEQIATFAGVNGIEPFRAGYEKDEQEEILARLKSGELKGVVSTSALEIGIDIPELSLGILWGVPPSRTSYVQRIGRIGRDMPGDIIVINSGFPHSSYIFDKPSRLDSMPLTESSLYLYNERVMYIHALCLAMRDIGENDKLLAAQSKNCDDDVALKCPFPKGFEVLCNNERNAQISEELDNIRNEVGGTPHLSFPLRVIEPQYHIKRIGSDDDIGRLSQSQVIREAYPGAVYFHRKQGYRVKKIDIQGRVVHVVPSKGVVTSRKALPVRVSPNLTAGRVRIEKYDALCVIDTVARVQETVVGFKEGNMDYDYPVDSKVVRYRQRYFWFSKRTDGIFIHLPEFNKLDVASLEAAGELLFNSFVATIPYDRQDVDFGLGTFGIGHPPGDVSKGDKFIVIFDTHAGSLRLSARLADVAVFRKCIEMAWKVANSDSSCSYSSSIVDIFAQLKKCADSAPVGMAGGREGNTIEAIRFGSYGLNRAGNRIVVDNVVYDRTMNALVYRGHGATPQDEHIVYRIPVNEMQECEDTEKGLYDLDSQEWLESE